MATHEKVDVAIVGAGPTGAIFADILTKAGKKVVILEFGPDWKHQDFISSEIWGRRIKHAPQFQMAGRNNPGHGSNAGWGAGGSMLHWFANFPRLLPVDFKVKSQYGRGMDWPISYDDLAPYYDRVAVELGVSGDAEKEKRWRPVTAPYPMPPLKTFRHGEIWREAFEAHNIPLAPMPTGINSTEYKGRPACLNDGWCHVGCPIGAHGQPLWTHLKEAREKGAEFRPFSYVTRVLTNDQGDRVTGVEYYDDKHEKQVQEASAVVLAAYSAEIPRIMLNSATDKHPKGLSNKNELVGKYLMTPFGRERLGDLRRERREPHGHDLDAIHVVRALRQGPPEERFWQRLLHHGQCAEAECRHRRRAPGAVRSAARRLHEAGGARARAHQRLWRGDAARGEPRRIVERQGRVRHADGENDPQLRSGRYRSLEQFPRRRARNREGRQTEWKPGKPAAPRPAPSISTAGPSWAPARRIR